MPDDAIRLTVPAAPDLAPVVVAAVGAAVRQTGLGGDEVTRAREHAAASFARQLETSSSTVTVVITLGTGEYSVSFER